MSLSVNPFYHLIPVSYSEGLMVLAEPPYHLIPLSYGVCPRPATTVTSDGVFLVSGCGGHLRLCDPLKSSSEGCKVCTVTTRTVVTTTTSVIAGRGLLDSPSCLPKENKNKKRKAPDSSVAVTPSSRPFDGVPAAEIPDKMGS